MASDVPLCRIWLLIVGVNLTAACLGFDTGTTSWVLVQLEDGTAAIDILILNHELLNGLITSLSFIGGAIGACFSFQVDVKGGPRDELMASAALCCIGAVGEGLIGLHAWTHAWYLIVFCAARLIYGVGFGIAMHTVPLFLAELSPASIRGRVVSCEEVFIVASMAFGYLLGAALPNAFMGFFAPAVASIVALLILPRLPRSPRYLLSHCNAALGAASYGTAALNSPSDAAAWATARAEALAALQFADPNAAEMDVDALIKEFADERTRGRRLELEAKGAEDMTPLGSMGSSPRSGGTTDGSQNDYLEDPALSPEGGAAGGGPQISAKTRRYRGGQPGWQPLEGENGSSAVVPVVKEAVFSVTTDPRMRQPLKVALGLMLLQQGCGSVALLVYAGVILRDMGMDVAVGVAAAGIVKLSCAIVAAFAMDCAGRRPLMLGGTLGMLFATVMLSAGCFAGLDTTGGRAVALTGFYMLVAAYELSVGPVAWVLLGELFPACYRREAASLAICTNFTAGAVVTMALPSLRAILGYDGLFGCFAVVCSMGLVFVYTNVMETKQLSLAQVQAALLAGVLIPEGRA